MRKYESLVIIDGTLGQVEREALIERYLGVAEKLGISMETVIRWGQRRLAYPINKKNQGYYVLFYFTADPALIITFHQQLQLNESILRFMTMLWNGKFAEYIRDEGSPTAQAAAAQTAAAVEPAEGGDDAADVATDEDAVEAVDDVDASDDDDDDASDDDDADDAADAEDTDKEEN